MIDFQKWIARAKRRQQPSRMVRRHRAIKRESAFLLRFIFEQRLALRFRRALQLGDDVCSRCCER